jgi:spore coat protein H
LNLRDPGRGIENSILVRISGSDYENIKATTGQKIIVKASTLIINGDTLVPEEINTRGQTTLYFPRKSLSFSLKSRATFRHGEKKESLKKFCALSLAMDKNYCNNRLAFQMMEAAQLFDLFYSFCELMINDHSEGIYMVIEKPEDWALKKKNSPLVMRRGYNNRIDKIKTGKKTVKDETAKYRNYFRQIYRSLNKYEGEELYKVLSKWLDTEVYMKWLAFNYFVRNGDYTDEVYFFPDPATEKFSIIPWDYDDIFALYPHEGNIQSKKLLEGKLFFSTEDRLDEKIVSDPYLYKKYLHQFLELMNQLSVEVIKGAFENTYAELYPYYSNEEIISNSKYDQYKDQNLENLKRNMEILYNQLLNLREVYLKYLGSIDF